MKMNNSSVPARILVYSTFAVILTIGMKEISSILTTIFFSIFVALIFTPLVRWFKRKGIPGVLSVLLVILLLTLIISVLAVVVVGAAVQIGNQLPNYQSRLIEILEELSPHLPSTEELSLQSIIRSIASVAISLTVSILNGLINAGTTVGIIIVTAAFLLLGDAGDQEKAEEQPILKSRLNKFGKGLVEFIVIRTEVNLVTAIGITVILLIGGIDFAIFWGIMAFFLGYIPYIGLALTAIPPAVFGLLQYGIVGSLAVIIAISIVNALTENVIFPSLAGRGLKLSPAIVFLSLLYWNYVLGATGMLLSTPLAMVLKIILESFEETKWLARLMGPDGNGAEGEENERQEKGS